MSNGLNLALVIRGDASGAKQAATETRTAVTGVGNEAQRTAAITQAANDQAAASARRVTEALTGQTQAQRNLQAAVASFAGVRSPANDDAYRQRAADVAAYGVSLDNLRAKYNPLFAAELSHIRNLAEIDRALKVGALSEREHAEAVARAASAYELQRAGLDAVAGSALAAKLQLEEYSRQALAARQQQAADRAQADVNQLLGVRDPSAMAGSARNSFSVFAAMPEQVSGAELDQLRAKYNALFGAELAHAKNLDEIHRALKVGALSEREHADAVQQAAAAYELQRAGLDAVAGSALAAKLQLEEYSKQALLAREQQASDQAQVRVNQLLGVRDPSAMAGSAKGSAAAFLAMPEAQEGAKNVALAAHEVTNLGYQMNDVTMMLMSGQSFGIIMAQQGAQISQIFGKRGLGEILPALGKSVAGLITPTTVFLAGITAAGYAGYYAFRALVPEVKALDDLLDDHLARLKDVTESYRDLPNTLRGDGRPSQAVQSFLSKHAADILREQVQKQAGQSLVDALTVDALTGGSASEGGSSIRTPSPGDVALGLGPALQEFIDGAKSGLAPIAKLNDELAILGQMPGSTPEMRARIATILEQTKVISDAQRAVEAYDRNIGPGGLLIGGSAFNQADMRAYEKYQQGENARLLQARASRDADLLGIYARSPEERAEAVRARERATRSESEGGAERSLRIETAGAMELARAYHELDEAQRQRLRSLDETLASARLDIELIGRTAGEATATQFAFEQFQQVRDEAMRNGITNEEEFQRLFGREIDLIVEATVKLKAYADAAARAKLRFDLQFEREQLGRSDVDARVADRLHSAGLSVELGSTEASLIRANELLKEQVELWKDIRQQGLDAYSDIFDLALDGFDDWEKSLGKIAKDLAKSAFDLGVKNPFLNSQFGSDLPTLDKTGGIGGWLATLLGRTANPAAGAQAIGGQNVASMDVTAAIVNINGTGNLGADLLAKLGVDKAGNDIIRMPLPDVAAKPAGETRTGIPLAEISTQGLTAKVAAQYADRFQGLFNDLEAAGYKIRSLGEGGYSFRNVAGTSNLSRHAFGEAIDINPRENPWSHVFRTDLPPNVNEIAKRNGLTWGGTWNKPDTMHFQVDRSAKLAAESLDRMSTNAIDAGRGLGALGKGMGDFGDALSKYPAAPALKGGAGGSGGGLNSLLGALFGGATGWGAAGNYLQSNPGNFIGLWEDGGPTPPGPKNKPVGIVHAGEVVWSQADVARAGGVHIVEALRLGRRGYENGGAVEGGFMLAGVGRGGNDTWSSSHYQPTAIERHYHDYAGVSVREEESDDGQGGRREDIYIEERITAAASRRGSSFNRALDARGARAPVKRR